MKLLTLIGAAAAGVGVAAVVSAGVVGAGRRETQAR